MSFPIPVTVLTGFLGAGKTTLLNRLLRDPLAAGTAVIVNELGDIGIDHLLVEQSSEGLIELSDGCLCCAVRGELVDTLADLLDRMQTGRIAPLKRIVIETTGLADPVPVLQALMGHPVLADMLSLDGVVTVVDAVNGAATLDRHAESVRQVAVADRLVLSKRAMADANAVPALTARLARLNAGATVLDGDDAVASGAAALFGLGLWNAATKSADVARWLGEAAHDDDDHHHHHDHDGRDHHHHHGIHDPRVKSFSLVHDRPVAWQTIVMFLDLLRSVEGERLLRMKGIVELEEGRERPLVIHGVQKLMHPPARLPAWPAGPRGTLIVLIGFDLDEAYVRKLFSAFTGAPAIDTPDRAALTQNPLAVPGFTG
jgi:G3E family GTPase